MKLPRIMIAAPGSGSGKTTVTCAVLKALKDSGCNPVSSKCGPDYIDPMFHTAVLGIPSNNLDLYFCEKELTKSLLADHAKDAGIAVLEGVMGYYDGRSMDTDAGSSYEAAKVTETPVILVVKSRGMALSLAAVIKGIAEFRGDSNIAGIILNEISGMLYPRLKEMLEAELHIPVVGYIPMKPEFQMKSRHLGLVTPEETKELKEQMELLGKTASETIDLKKIMEIAQSAPDLHAAALHEGIHMAETHVRIGIAKDQAFQFYYADNLKYLQKAGCELVCFSPLSDRKLPEDLDGIYLGGGYPEVYADRLAQNKDMRMSVKDAAASGLPCIAECGGFMYLHDFLEGGDGRQYPMTGVMKGCAYRTDHLVHFGYAALTAKEDQAFQNAGETLKVHEFHYWDSTDAGSCYHAVKPDGRKEWDCIHVRGNLFAGYPHLHFYANDTFAARFVSLCARKEKRS